MRKSIVFTGRFGDYFIKSLGLLFLSIITFGLAFPYWIYWSTEYFFNNLEYNGSKIHFTGTFGEYFIMSLGLFVLSVITCGIAFPYWMYWSFQYFFSRMEIEEFIS
jgi:uncharacterized membrane protein YjgN (DUF898 family)